MKYYFDTEDGPSKETSHPNFVKRMPSDFYYDCTDEYAPFGNDDGADLLYNLEDWYRERKLTRNIVKWMFNQIDQMGFAYQSQECSEIMDLETLRTINEEDEYLISSMDSSIIATGFGQVKVTGKIDVALREIVLRALDRQVLLNEDDAEYSGHLEIMKKDLMSFK